LVQECCGIFDLLRAALREFVHADGEVFVPFARVPEQGPKITGL
jgi:hypothetical protein